MKFLEAEKCKTSEINRKMCDVYGEASFSRKKKKEERKFTNRLNIGFPP